MSPAGALIMSVFAAVWCVVGMRASGTGWLGAILPALGITGALVLVALRLGRNASPLSEAEQSRQGRLVGWASAAEGVAILIAANVLANTGHRALTASAVAIIVGLHFVPLARGLPAPSYYATAALLVGIGIAGALAADPTRHVRDVSIGAAVVLWATAASVLWRSARQSASPARIMPG